MVIPISFDLGISYEIKKHQVIFIQKTLLKGVGKKKDAGIQLYSVVKDQTRVRMP
jgi:hypothetical protein